MTLCVLSGLLLLLSGVAAASQSPPSQEEAFRSADRYDCDALRARTLAVDDDMEQFILRLHAIRCAFGAGSYETASRDFLALHEERPDQLADIADSLRWVGELHARALLHDGQAEQALSHFQVLLGRSDDRSQGRVRQARAIYHVGLAHEAAEEQEAARAAWDRLRNEFPGSRYAALLAPLMIERGESADALMQRAQRALDDRNYVAAQELFVRAACAGRAACDPHEAAAAGGERYEAAWRVGHLLYRYRREHVERSEPWLRAVLAQREDGPRYADAAYTLGLALMRMQRSEDARRHWKAFEDTFPRERRRDAARYFRGWMSFVLGEYEEATGHFEQYIATWPRGARVGRAWWWAGWSHYRLDQCAAAIRSWAHIADGERNRPAAQIRYWTAVCHDKLGDGERAAELWGRIQEENPLTWYALLASRRLGDELLQGLGARPEPPRRNGPGASLAAQLGWIGLLDEAEWVYEQRRHEDDDAEELAFVLGRRGDWIRWRRQTQQMERRVPNDDETLRQWRRRYPPFYPGPVARAAEQWGVPEFVIRGVIQQESAWDRDALSSADAMGLMQVIPQTAEAIAADRDVPYEDGLLFEPRHAIDFGAWYLGALVRKFDGQLLPAVGAYNAGPVAMANWLDRAGGEVPVDEFVEEISYDETRSYVRRVVAWALRYGVADARAEDLDGDTLGGLLPHTVRPVYGDHPSY